MHHAKTLDHVSHRKNDVLDVPIGLLTMAVEQGVHWCVETCRQES